MKELTLLLTLLVFQVTISKILPYTAVLLQTMMNLRTSTMVLMKMRTISVFHALMLTLILELTICKWCKMDKRCQYIAFRTKKWIKFHPCAPYLIISTMWLYKRDKKWKMMKWCKIIKKTKTSSSTLNLRLSKTMYKTSSQMRLLLITNKALHHSVSTLKMNLLMMKIPHKINFLDKFNYNLWSQMTKRCLISMLTMILSLTIQI